MQHGFGLDVPETLEDICHPARMAIIVYDMQAGILSQLPNAQAITQQVVQVLNAARAGGFRNFYTRHMSLPSEAAGVFQLRTAMAWQRAARLDQVKPAFLRDSPPFQLVPELEPRASEVIFDKITMSCFVGTPLDLALRDCAINAFNIVGVAIEIGIEPTARHGTDLGYIPVIVTDACGAGNEEAAQRSIESLKFAGDALITDTETICTVFQNRSGACSV